MPEINWGQVGQGAISNLIGTGMGLLLEGHNDKRQLEQQKKLQEMQMWGNKEMMDYSMMKQMEMWQNTNYGAQMQEIANAGLNPALLYGKAGAGGTTTGSPQGNVQGATAPQGGMEIMNMMMLKAQMGLIQAQTEKTKAETGNVPLQGKNIEANTALTEIQTKLKNGTYDYDKEAAYEAMVQLGQQNRILSSQADVAEGTQNTQIEQQKQTLLETMAKIGLAAAGTDTQRASTQKIVTEIAQMAQKLQNETNQIKIQQQLADFQTKWGDDAGSVLKQIVNQIFGILKR